MTKGGKPMSLKDKLAKAGIAELAAAAGDVLSEIPPCCCDVYYTTRRRDDPACIYHHIGEEEVERLRRALEQKEAPDD